jgi:predicted DNA-binding transcriptional regulator AlpA
LEKISMCFRSVIFAIVVILLAGAGALALITMPWDQNCLDTFTVAMTVIGARAERVIRLHELPAFLGVKRSQINEAIRAGLLHPISVIPGGRSKCVTESEVIALQQQAIAEAAAATGPVKEIAPNRKRRLAGREGAAAPTTAPNQIFDPQDAPRDALAEME